MSDELLESSSDVDVAVLLGALPLAAAISSSSEPEGGLKSEEGEHVVERRAITITGWIF